VREARGALSVGNTKLYQMIESKLLDARKTGNRTVISHASLMALIDKLPVLRHRTYDSGLSKVHRAILCAWPLFARVRVAECTTNSRSSHPR
jgi:hypothetical protein